MSLTSFLKLPDVKEKFRQEFKVPKLAVQKKLLAPPLSKRYALVGTAFDYLLRFYLQRLNEKNAIRRSWVAEDSLNVLYKAIPFSSGEYNLDTGKLVIKGNDDLIKKAKRVFSQAGAEHERYVVTGDITGKLIKSTIYLAQLDFIYRVGYIDENLGTAYKEDVQDLQNLIAVVTKDLFRAKNVCLLNPTFGSASTLVGGADADLLIDDTLIDIKTTKNFRLDADHFFQLLGYFVLHTIAGIGDLEPKREIKKLAIYYSRHAHLEVFELQDIVNPKTFPKFVKWFSVRARQMHKSRITRRSTRTRKKRRAG